MNTKKRVYLAIAIIITTIFAVFATFWMFGGRLLWIRFIMELPIPATWKALLWGWY